jgi:hypothetical protein
MHAPDPARLAVLNAERIDANVQRIAVNVHRIDKLEDRLAARITDSDAVISDYLRRIVALEAKVDRLTALLGGPGDDPGSAPAPRRPAFRVIRGLGEPGGPTIIAFELRPMTGWFRRLRSQARWRLAPRQSRS